MLIGICGGIGSGKSVVSRILREEGYMVYDCDSRARNMMNEDAVIKSRIRDEISADVTDGIVAPDRKRLAEIVFADENLRLKLNEIVHGAVLKDIGREYRAFAGDRFFVESALLAESGIAEICDDIWMIEADVDVRVNAVMKRDRCTAHHALSRIRSQKAETEAMKRYSNKTSKIFNYADKSLLRQIKMLIK